MKENRFFSSTVGGIRLHVLPTDRFKTFAISLYIGTPLAEETVTSTALIPFVLRRGSATYPETKQFRERLDDLYGAGFGFDIYKRGDSQLVQFRMDIINDKFVQNDASLLREGLRFLGEAVTKPALTDGVFQTKYVDAEKETLRKKLEAIINDKIRYAGERCMEEMCKNEPYRLNPLGKLEDIDSITAENLYARYRQWLADSPMDLYVIGQTTLEEVEAIAKEAFDLNDRKTTVPGYPASPIQAAAGNEPKVVVEELDVGQGKLNMGLRFGISYGDDRYAAALMYNGILGSFPHSKLFINVREKESLAYYASSRFDGHKGILTIQSGIEIENYEKAVAIIKKQLEDMKAGNYSELELTQTRAMIRNHLQEIGDSAFEMIAFHFNNVLSGKERTTEELLAQVDAVTPEDIKKAAALADLDTIYFLRDRKGE
ncbi:EF-P 5-aminopentanol modification-associated protein YfmF [Gorillibacterium massiliense]|uniref:EF-P 5-aminopentanol modification-associated protein YfmF n=1 Tax=Gorillibacterium massiliense TaxID=1280390 RepID=UPI0004B1AD67|nr:pitrilysin family protein [Gorillibacterium massiliense]